MKILVAVWSIRIGGAETFSLQLCEYLQRQGHSCYLFPVVGPWDLDYYRLIQERGVTILTPFLPGFVDWVGWKVNGIFSKFFKQDFRLYLTELYFNYILKRYSFNCIVSNSVLSDSFIAQQDRRGVPFVAIEHGEYSRKIIENQDIELGALNSADKVVFVSQWCRRVLFSKVSSRMNYNVIYNGHTRRTEEKIEQYHKNLSENFVFGMIGRGVESKGWEEAIKAFLVVKANHQNIRLLLIGDGEFLQQLKTQYGNDPSILFVGRKTNPQDWIQYVDVGLLLSQKYEAFGLAILDFFAQKKPVISTDIGGIPEVVYFKNKKGGILIPTDEIGKADISKTAYAMTQMLMNCEIKQKASQHAGEIYEHFTFEKTGRKYLNLIEGLVLG